MMTFVGNNKAKISVEKSIEKVHGNIPLKIDGIPLKNLPLKYQKIDGIPLKKVMEYH